MGYAIVCSPCYLGRFLPVCHTRLTRYHFSAQKIPKLKQNCSRILVVDVGWWTEEAVILAFKDGGVAISALHSANPCNLIGIPSDLVRESPHPPDFLGHMQSSPLFHSWPAIAGPAKKEFYVLECDQQHVYLSKPKQAPRYGASHPHAFLVLSVRTHI